MIESRGGARFQFQTLELSFVGDQCTREQLQADLATEPFVISEVNNAHPAGAEHSIDSIRTEPLADERFGIGAQKFWSDRGGGRSHKIAGLIMVAEEQLDLPAQRRVAF